MVKAYLRYDQAQCWGVITSRSNVVFNFDGKLLFAGALESVAVWDIKQGQLVSNMSIHRLANSLIRGSLLRIRDGGRAAWQRELSSFRDRKRRRNRQRNPKRTTLRRVWHVIGPFLSDLRHRFWSYKEICFDRAFLLLVGLCRWDHWHQRPVLEGQLGRWLNLHIAMLQNSWQSGIRTAW